MDTGKWGFRAGSVPDWMSRWMDRGKERKNCTYKPIQVCYVY